MQCAISVTSSHAAYNVTVDVTTHSARISWYPAYDAGHPLHYVIWWVTSGTCCWIFISKHEQIWSALFDEWRLVSNSSRPLVTGIICHYWNWKYYFPSPRLWKYFLGLWPRKYMYFPNLEETIWPQRHSSFECYITAIPECCGQTDRHTDDLQ